MGDNNESPPTPPDSDVLASVAQGVIMLSVLLVAGALLFRVNLGPDPCALPR